MKWEIDPASEPAQRNQYRVSVPRRFWLYRMVTSKGVVYGLADGETPVCMGTKEACIAAAIAAAGNRPTSSATGKTAQHADAA